MKPRKSKFEPEQNLNLFLKKKQKNHPDLYYVQRWYLQSLSWMITLWKALALRSVIRPTITHLTPYLLLWARSQSSISSSSSSWLFKLSPSLLIDAAAFLLNSKSISSSSSSSSSSRELLRVLDASVNSLFLVSLLVCRRELSFSLFESYSWL